MALTPVPVADAVLTARSTLSAVASRKTLPGLIIAEVQVTFTSGDAYAANGVALDLSARLPEQGPGCHPGLFNTEANSGAA